jgi:cysteine desulfurase
VVGTAPSGFLDAASGQPLNAGGREALLAAFDAGWADPARLYRDGRRAAMLLDAARASVATALGKRPAEVSFTSSATTAVHRAILGTLAARPGRLVVSAVEHSAVLRAGDLHERQGGLVTTVGVDAQGRVDLAAFSAAVHTPGTSLACLQMANHEVGTLQPVEQAVVACRSAGVPLLVDVTHTLGRIDPPEADLLVADAHMWGGPAGVGVLVVTSGTHWRPTGPLDEREGSRNPGPPAVALIVVAARALEWALAHRDADNLRALTLTDDMRNELSTRVPGLTWLGASVERIPHLITFSCLYTDAESLVGGLDAAGFAVSSGSSCVADTQRPSHVLTAMGAPSGGNVRVSLPWGTAVKVSEFATSVEQVVHRIRRDFGALDLPGMLDSP